jgi:hypothetical protein
MCVTIPRKPSWFGMFWQQSASHTSAAGFISRPAGPFIPITNRIVLGRVENGQRVRLVAGLTNAIVRAAADEVPA